MRVANSLRTQSCILFLTLQVKISNLHRYLVIAEYISSLVLQGVSDSDFLQSWDLIRLAQVNNHFENSSRWFNFELF